jgi:protein-S-isoprenylcysteine O-methyltransferase Ste14
MILLKTLAHTLVFPGTVLVLVPYLLINREAVPALCELDWWTVAGSLWVLAGIVVGLWCTVEFMSRGSGTPNPLEPPKVLLDHGLYRYIRNPMYVSVALILIGEALFLRSVALAIYGAVLMVGVHLLVVWYEEPILRQRFGASYEAYCHRVPRWIPGSRAA